MTRAVANRYVEALADVMLEPGSGATPEFVLAQLQTFGELLRESSDLDRVLRSPAVPPADKRALLTAISSRAGLSELMRNFLCVVVDHRRIAHFNLLLQGFEAWLDAHRNRVQVEIRVAESIDADQRNALERRFAEITGKQVRATYVVDPSLLGGSLAVVGSTLYDGSLRSALGALAAGMANRNR